MPHARSGRFSREVDELIDRIAYKPASAGRSALLEMDRRRLISVAAATAASPSLAWANSALPLEDAARDAFFHIFPVFEFARTGWAASGPRPDRSARYNQLAHRRSLADHTRRDVTTPNNDTLYTSARLDLTNGPVLIALPDVYDRYFSAAFLNAFTDNFHYIGTRSTGGRGGVFQISAGSTPIATPRGVTAIHSPTDDVWMLARVEVFGENDIPAASAVQDQIRILCAPRPRIPEIPPRDARDAQNFLSVANEMLARCSRSNEHVRRAADFARLGVRRGDVDAWLSLRSPVRAAWTSEIEAGLAALRSSSGHSGEIVRGWRYPPDGIGSARQEAALRAEVALSGLGALERAEAIYVRTDEDSTGEALSGSGMYRLLIPADVPVDGFWSLSIYRVEDDGRLYFSENAIGRHSIGDRTRGLVREPDGPLTITIQHTQPADALSNWLPSPGGRFALVFRAYVPRSSLLAGEWRLPPVVRL